MANIFGFSHLVDKSDRVTYDSDVEDAFHIYSKNGMIKFKRTKEGLYCFKPSPGFLQDVADEKKMMPESHIDNTIVGDVNSDTNADTGNCRNKAIDCLVTTVEENCKGYSQRQFLRAKEARKLYHILGCPTVENMKHIIRQNIIKNCPVSIEH